MIIDNPTEVTFEVTPETRTIRGLALPFGDVAESQGLKWTFGPGSLTWGKVKVLDGHDWSKAAGTCELTETPEGLLMVAKIANGPRGDELLSLAADGVYDGLSVGLAPDLKATRKDGVNHATSGTVREVSLTPIPSFERASVTSVAASAAQGKEPIMGDTTEATVVSTQAPEAPDFSAVTTAITEGFAALGKREVVPAGAQFAVVEEAPYRFDGTKGAHDFSTDLIQGLKFNDSEAMTRVNGFIEEAFSPAFAVTTANAATLNPNRNRPDMYVSPLDYVLPFYNALHKGTLTDQTPFTFPKFATSANLVKPHVEGVEPTPGSFTATSQTVTPSAVSGKVEITREVWDQGGNPQVSGLIWKEMTRAYFEALEASAVGVLAASAPTAIALAGKDAALVGGIEAALADLQFERGGNRYDFMGTHRELYKALAAASDSTGRRLLPILNPQNADGSAAPGFRSLDVAGTTAVPAWGLGGPVTTATSSYLVNSSDVHVWNSAPQRLEFQYRVAFVDLAIWGYVATAISRLDGVRKLTYTRV